MLAITSNRSTLRRNTTTTIIIIISLVFLRSVLRLLVTANVPSSPTLYHPDVAGRIPPKRLFLQEQHRVTLQKTAFLKFGDACRTITVGWFCGTIQKWYHAHALSYPRSVEQPGGGGVQGGCTPSVVEATAGESVCTTNSVV
jgi:hypothetical protein